MIDNRSDKYKVLLLFRENLPSEIPADLLADKNLLIVHETQSFPAGTFSGCRAISFEQFAELDGMMQSVWNQINWLKRWGDIPLKDGKSFKELYQYHDLPLWYFAELYLHYPKFLLRIITLIDIFHLLFDSLEIEEVLIININLPLVRITAKAAEIKEVPITLLKDRGSAPFKMRIREKISELSPRIVASLYLIKQITSILFLKCMTLRVRKKIRPFIYNGAGYPPENTKRICIVSHGSYWRKSPTEYRCISSDLDMYWDRLIDELNEETTEKEASVTVLGVGPRQIHKKRTRFTKFKEFFLPLGESLPYVPIKYFSTIGTYLRTRRGAKNLFKQSKQFIRNPELRDSIVYRGVNFFDEFRTELKRCFLLMLPWGIKIIEQSLSAFEKLKPHVICLYAEAGGYGRAVTYAAKLQKIETVAIQHGLIFPHNYTYVHTADEIKGKIGAPYPYTDKFLLYDRFVKDILEKHGNYPSKTFIVTGGHKMDNLIAMKKRIDPLNKKKDLGFNERDRFAVIASRFSEIGSAFPAIVEAIESIPRFHLIVKPHQAELPSHYQDIVDEMRAKQVRIVSNKENLFDLMIASDLLITVNSLAAIEALLLEKPVMVVNLPNHLSVYVDAGIAVGIKSHGEILPELKKILSGSHSAISKRQEEFSRKHSFMTDGLSGERIKKEIYKSAEAALKTSE